MCPNWPKNGVFVSFLKFKPSDSADFAYLCSFLLSLNTITTEQAEKNFQAVCKLFKLFFGYFLKFSSLEIVDFVHFSYFRLHGVPPLFLPYCLFVSVQHCFLKEWKFFKEQKNSVEKYCFLKRGVSWVCALSRSLLIVRSMIYLYEKFVTPAAFLLISVFCPFGKYSPVSAPVSIILFFSRKLLCIWDQF